MKLIRVKTKDAKKCDLKPRQRIKVAGNVFVEIYKDNKGYFYRIDIPGATEFVCKERYPNPDKASLAGRTHAQKFMKKIKGDADSGVASKEKVEALKKLNKAMKNVENNFNEVSKALDEFKKAYADSPEIVKHKFEHWNQLVNHFYKMQEGASK